MHRILVICLLIFMQILEGKEASPLIDSIKFSQFILELENNRSDHETTLNTIPTNYNPVNAPKGTNETETIKSIRIYGPPILVSMACGEGKVYYIDDYCTIQIIENNTVFTQNMPCFFVCKCEWNMLELNGICMPGNSNKSAYDSTWKNIMAPVLIDNSTSTNAVDLYGVNVYAYPSLDGRGCGKNMTYQKITYCDYELIDDYGYMGQPFPCLFACNCKIDYIKVNDGCLWKYEVEENYVIIPPEGTNKIELESSDLIYGPPYLKGVACGRYKEYRDRYDCIVYAIDNGTFLEYSLPCYYTCNCIEGYYDDNGTCKIIKKGMDTKKYFFPSDNKSLPHQNHDNASSKESRNLLGEVVYGFPKLKGRGCGYNKIYRSLSSCDYVFSFDMQTGKRKVPCKFECVCIDGTSELNGRCQNDSYISTLPTKLGDRIYYQRNIPQNCGEYMTYQTVKICTLHYSYDRRQNQYYPCIFECMCNKGYKSHSGICVKNREY